MSFQKITSFIIDWFLLTTKIIVVAIFVIGIVVTARYAIDKSSINFNGKFILDGMLVLLIPAAAGAFFLKIGGLIVKINKKK